MLAARFQPVVESDSFSFEYSLLPGSQEASLSLFAMKSFQIITILETSYLHKKSLWMNSTILTLRITQNDLAAILIKINHEVSPSILPTFISNIVNTEPYNKIYQCHVKSISNINLNITVVWVSLFLLLSQPCSYI